MSPKELVKQFYEYDLLKNKIAVEKYFHKDCQLHWNSSKGFQVLNYDNILTFFNNINETYHNLRSEISHLLQEGDFVTTRYTVFGSTMENQDEEMPLAHYISIWQIKDGKFFKGHQISQLADEAAIKANSFSEIKV
ncbi:nuclear transport factor 2 family protein [Formosa maritima]|uniref:Nuclear transport factor 2 family protein n=1 Tax=Formosa maritima TaxID=2592046 RepID=A0A5D0GJC3_9FLAO|nr:nuclear transport factor 2 family protein [Formosa maritima]TYA58956.1 nuclear transport factor 2 family protein [Formosa maritima]